MNSHHPHLLPNRGGAILLSFLPDLLTQRHKNIGYPDSLDKEFEEEFLGPYLARNLLQQRKQRPQLATVGDLWSAELDKLNNLT